MTRTPENELDAAFAEARAQPPRFGADLQARILADGAAQQARLAPKPARRPAFRMSWRLWPAASALATSLVIGIGLGSQFDAEILSLGTLYAMETTQTETVLWSFDLALEGGI